MAMALAMGAVNNVFQRDGEVSIGVTYMTGSLVKLGQQVALLLLSRNGSAWLPYLLLWSSFTVGVVAAALAFPLVGIAPLWAVVGILLALAWLCRPTGPTDGQGRVSRDSSVVPAAVAGSLVQPQQGPREGFRR